MVIVRGVRKIAASAGDGRFRVTRRLGDPYWRERGWVTWDGHCHGYYQAGGQSFEGRVDLPGREFFIRYPPPELKKHPHWPCFWPRNDGWFKVHFAIEPGDISSGIMQIERMLHEALGTNERERVESFWQCLSRLLVSDA
jgi:hypothetical protein